MKKSSIKDRICVYKDGHRKYIKPSLLQEYIDNGYSKSYKTKEILAIDELTRKISYNDLYNYYEILNHTKKETLVFFNLKISQLNSLLLFYNIKKSTKNRGTNSKKGKFLKYGDENYNNREKATDTCLQKYGVENPLQLDYVREKTTSHETREKAQQTYLLKTGKKTWNDGEQGVQK